MTRVADTDARADRADPAAETGERADRTAIASPRSHSEDVRRSVDPAAAEPTKPAAEPATAPVRGTAQHLRLGSIGIRSALVYLLVWSAVLFVVELAVFAVGYVALERFGVLASLSRSAATILSQPVPESGVLPALTFPELLPYALVLGAAMSLLWLIASLAFVCVHNAVSTMTGGLRVRVR